jgi:hypothetical protein
LCLLQTVQHRPGVDAPYRLLGNPVALQENRLRRPLNSRMRHLTENTAQRIVMVSMRVLRTVLAVCLTVSVAMLPGTKFVFASADLASSMMHEDGQPCHKKDSQNDCCSSIGCALNCFKFTGVVGFDYSAKPAIVSLDPVLSTVHPWRKSVAPPLPPPRL